MKRIGIVWAAIVTAVCSAGASVQDTTTSRATQSEQNTITVVGCLQQGNQMSGATGTTGSATSTTTAPSSASGSGFILTKASVSSTPPSTTTASTTTATTSGTSTTPGATMSGSGATYVLDGKSDDLRPHLNHQVRITGRLDTSSTGASRTGTTTSTSTSGTSPTQNAQRLRVESVQMVASTCPSR